MCQSTTISERSARASIDDAYPILGHADDTLGTDTQRILLLVDAINIVHVVGLAVALERHLDGPDREIAVLLLVDQRRERGLRVDYALLA